MSQIQIVEMTKKEIPKVAKIEREVFSCPWSEQSFTDTLYQDNVKFFLAMEDEKVLGYCGLYMAADKGEITNVAVGQKFRRRHIADMMLKSLLKAGEDNGVRCFYLEVRISNYAAIGLYEKHGFTKKGIRKGFYDKPREDAYVMGRVLE